MLILSERLAAPVAAASRAEPTAQAAQRAMAALDLTSLNETDDDAGIAALCDRALTPAGPVAAVCLFPRFVTLARQRLDGLPVRVATVANFPEGGADWKAARQQVRLAVAEGAQEVDVVFPYRPFLARDREAGPAMVAACREACGEAVALKVILETGAFDSVDAITDAGHIAIAAGADFLKTSTGKVPVNATPEAARILLETIRDSGRDAGCKVSGGIRTADQALEYLELAAEVMGERWIEPRHFRIGASGLLDDLLERLRDEPEA
jgi:deoxyribose-phosphate aldolase